MHGVPTTDHVCGYAARSTIQLRGTLNCLHNTIRRSVCASSRWRMWVESAPIEDVHVPFSRLRYCRRCDANLAACRQIENTILFKQMKRRRKGYCYIWRLSPHPFLLLPLGPDMYEAQAPIIFYYALCADRTVTIFPYGGSRIGIG
ncbi:hypothetical protein EVAR_14399_1 [Eumeta japonica]|uniref:Uncharacterized protein n=1 Tax=Eumeta variegata TaxID=151549 RepID=A0A4C1TX68_EUMVA|nr:hypothetical protein EVAR_14399_1 [Eumeta japonica]